MSDLIQDRGRGPEIVDTRVTVYNLLSDFLDPSVTEARICQVYELTQEQVAAARAYVMTHPETVLAEHLQIEERLQADNPPQVREQAEKAKSTFRRFKQWLEQQRQLAQEDSPRTGRLPTFREWLASRAGD